jgi:hypothetical protein
VAHIVGSIRIAASQPVFDAVADSRLEPSFNPATRQTEPLAEEPIGIGTEFLPRIANAART